MPAAIESIALFAPVVASNAVFSARRASRGIDNMDTNPLFGLANIDIAAGQILKGSRAAKGIAIAADPTLGEVAEGASKAIKEASKTSKLLSGVSKVVNFTADNINPIIVGGGILKVAGADDKIDEAGRESLRLGCMFLGEGVTKSFIGMPIVSRKDGKTVTVKREAMYEKLFSDAQNKAIEDFINSKKAIKYAASGAKGLLFVGASMAGYKLGDILANKILGEKKATA